MPPSRGLSCASERPFVIERQVCSLSTKPHCQLHCITRTQFVVTVQRIAKHCLPASVEARVLNLKYARVTGELNHGSFAPAAECLTTLPPRPLRAAPVRHVHCIGRNIDQLLPNKLYHKFTDDTQRCTVVDPRFPALPGIADVTCRCSNRLAHLKP